MKLRIFENTRSFEADLSGPVVLGRQKPVPPENETEGGPFWATMEGDRPVRVVVAWNPEVHAFSREHCRLEPLPDGRVRVANLSPRFALRASQDGVETVIPIDKAADLTIPLAIHLEGRTVLVGEPEAQRGAFCGWRIRPWFPDAGRRRRPRCASLRS